MAQALWLAPSLAVPLWGRFLALPPCLPPSLPPSPKASPEGLSLSTLPCTLTSSF